MSVVAKRIVSRPVRTSKETWDIITKIVCKDDKKAAAEFDHVSGIASAIISEEYPAKFPIVVKGNGPRVRVYCLYDEDAIVGEEAREEELNWPLTSENWVAYLPCSKNDIDWMSKNLADLSKNFKVYDKEIGLALDEQKSDVQENCKDLKIDEEAFKKL